LAIAHSPAEFETFLAYLSTSRGFDFTAYKRATLTRRVQKRMQEIDIESYADYTDYLETHPDEFTELFNTILINVTAFFRDGAPWETLARDVIPRIIETKGPSDPIRIWSAGCASGEEAYTLAMLFAEALGGPEYAQRVKIYGTDVDEDALTTARHASYSGKALDAVPVALREKYFERVNGAFSFRKDLRRTVIFGRLDLLQDAPISRVDLLVCRNTLMYFNSDAQARVIARFMFAMADHGFLMLGKAETLLTHATMLTPIDLKLRIFQKTVRGFVREQQPGALPKEYEPLPPQNSHELRALAFEADPAPQITIDASGILVGCNDRARQMFGVRPTDIGRPLKDLELSYRPVELRSLIEQAQADRRTVVTPEIEWTTAGGLRRWFNIMVAPLWQDGRVAAGANVVFTDVTRFKELQQEVERSKSELETAYEELQSTNEELETTNEELQSTVEELETTNEELQSTNEELETMNEELQSTNEELETVNLEIRDRGNELNRVNSFLETILTSLQIGVVVIDRELMIRAWNRTAEDLWGLRSDEVIGTHFINLDIGLAVDQLRPLIRDCLAGSEQQVKSVMPATNRRGRQISCEVTCMPQTMQGEVTGVIVLMEELDGVAAAGAPSG
jgi:two-component system CheB/CheR fusion protein